MWKPQTHPIPVDSEIEAKLHSNWVMELTTMQTKLYLHGKEERFPHIERKTVIASDALLMDVRHFVQQQRMAEIKVPACPIPIQKTKFTMAHPSSLDCFSQTPTPVETR